MLKKRRIGLALVWLGLLWMTTGVHAQTDVQFEAVQVRYTFAETMTFSAQVTPSDAPLRSVTLFLQAPGESQTRVYVFEPHPDGHYDFTLPLEDAALVPFSQLTFWYGATLDDDTTILSVRYHFTYDDNRFTWQTLESGQISVHWYAGDLAYGQMALDVAAQTAARMQTLAALPSDARLNVYLYASFEDLRAALPSEEAEWVGSHAYPPLGVALVTVPPGVEQRSQMERQIPHEVMHVLIYQSVSGDYDNLPVWLREGLASQAELHTNPDYAQTLQAASQAGAILHLSDLCQTFPLDSGRAFLAYAESDSFVRWLRGKYGDASLRSLMQAYADGLSCSQGAWQALGTPLDLLEYRWREDVLGERAWRVALRALWPYLVLLASILLVPFWQFFLIQEQA